MPDQNFVRGKVVLVTGATDGLGEQTALQLAALGAHVLVHGRNRAKAEAVVDNIRQATGSSQLDVFIADLASLQQVRDLAARVQARYPAVHVLINNAGVYLRQRKLTEDGLEMTFAVNHLAPFLLTHLLLDTLVKSAPARVINVSSTTHQSARLDPANLQGEKHYDAYGAYALSKLGNILFTYELARRLRAESPSGSLKLGALPVDVTANCLHPGGVNTKLLRAGWGTGGISPEQGAETQVYLAASPEAAGLTGKYFVKKRETRSTPHTYDREQQAWLWQASEKLAGLG